MSRVKGDLHWWQAVIIIFLVFSGLAIGGVWNERDRVQAYVNWMGAGGLLMAVVLLGIVGGVAAGIGIGQLTKQAWLGWIAGFVSGAGLIFVSGMGASLIPGVGPQLLELIEAGG